MVVPTGGCIHVVAGAVTAGDGRILIAQRPPGTHLAGGWEFPGGKLEPGESRPAGLARELAEELGIAIREPRPLLRIRHRYPTREVLIDLWVVSRYAGIPRGLDGQALRWLTQDELATAPLLPADRPIVRALRLPEILRDLSTPAYAVADCPTPAEHARADGRLRGVRCASADAARRAAARGAEFVALSLWLPVPELEALCAAVPIPVFARDLPLERAWAAGASGLDALGP